MDRRQVVRVCVSKNLFGHCGTTLHSDPLRPSADRLRSYKGSTARIVVGWCHLLPIHPHPKADKDQGVAGGLQRTICHCHWYQRLHQQNNGFNDIEKAFSHAQTRAYKEDDATVTKGAVCTSTVIRSDTSGTTLRSLRPTLPKC